MVEALSSAFHQGKWWGAFLGWGPLNNEPLFYTIGYHHFPFKSNETVKKKILQRIKSAHYNWRIVMIQKGKTKRHPIVLSYQCSVFKVVSTKYINNSCSTVEQCKTTSCLEYVGGIDYTTQLYREK